MSSPQDHIQNEIRRLQDFNDQVRDYAHVDLLEAYAKAFSANQYGSHVAELSILRFHILTRMSGGAAPEDA